MGSVFFCVLIHNCV